MFIDHQMQRIELFSSLSGTHALFCLFVCLFVSFVLFAFFVFFLMFLPSKALQIFKASVRMFFPMDSLIEGQNQIRFIATFITVRVSDIRVKNFRVNATLG